MTKTKKNEEGFNVCCINLEFPSQADMWVEKLSHCSTEASVA